MALESKRKRITLLKEKNLPRKKRPDAPKGYHYMPDGTLMSDSDMERLELEKIYGEDLPDVLTKGVVTPQDTNVDGASIETYEVPDRIKPKEYKPNLTGDGIKEEEKEVRLFVNPKSGKEKLYKVIYGLNIDLSDLNTDGETREFHIVGDEGAMFNLQVYEEVDGKYYNFHKQTWSTTPSTLMDQVITTNSYNGSIKFSTVATKILKYVIRINAVQTNAFRTRHVPFKEVRRIDGTIDDNRSEGSRSALLTKRIYAQPKKTLRLSCIAPSRSDAVTDTKDGVISSGTSLVMDTSYLTKGIKVGDVVTGTNISATITAVNVGGVADTYTISTAPTGTVSDGATLTFTGPFNGMTPRYGTTTGSDSITLPTGSKGKRTFTITLTAATGKAFTILRQPKEGDLCAVRLITFDSAASAITGEDTSSSSLFYRWPVTSTNGGVFGLMNGMVLDPSSTGSQGGTNTTYDSIISDYSTYASRVGKYEELKSVDTYVKGVTYTGDATISTSVAGDRVVHQAGNLVFNKQQLDALKSDANAKIIGYGRENIRSMTWGTDVTLSDLKVVLTEASTTTTGSVSNSTTIPVTEQKGIMDDVSRMSGVNVAATAVLPTVTAKAAASGSGNLTVSVAQTLDSGQTLVFKGAGSVATITGTLEILDSGPDDVVLYFDIERFLHCA